MHPYLAKSDWHFEIPEKHGYFPQLLQERFGYFSLTPNLSLEAFIGFILITRVV